METTKSAVTPMLGPVEARQQVRAGSAIVVIPYTAYLQPDARLRLSTYTEIATHAAAALYHTAGVDGAQVIAVGEHTYGASYRSTTDLIYDELLRCGVPAAAFALTQPQRADATPQQLAWLAERYGLVFGTHIPVLVGHRSHWARIEQLCAVYDMPAQFVDAGTLLAAEGQLTPRYRRAIAVYEAEGRQYEARAQRLTDMVAWLGPTALTMAFKALVRLRSPNVVELAGTGAQARLYAVTARQHVKYLKKAKSLSP